MAGKSSGKIAVLVLSLLLVAVLVLGALFAVRDVRAKEYADRRNAVEQQIRTLRRIAGSEYLYRNVIYLEQERRVLGRIPTGSTEVLFSVTIRVQAGVDLSRGFAVQADESRPERVYITIPEPEIFLVDADESSIEEYFSKERLMRLDWLDLGGEIETQKDLARDDALERGILNQAQNNVGAVLSDMLKSAGFPDVRIRFAGKDELLG